MKSEEDKTEDKLFQDILKGKYRDFYLVYNRKSSDEPNNQKNSITFQTSENGRYCDRENLQIAHLTIKGFCLNGIISERHSGFKEDDAITFSKNGLVQYRIERPKFLRLIQFLSKGLFKGVVCLCWDRISRNKGDDTLIRKLMRNGIDVCFVYAKYEKTSSGALHMDIDGMVAENHSRVTSEKVILATWNLRERGICTYRAPVGYLNLGQMSNKPLDHERASIIKRMFELYATGNWAIADLARWANKQGLTTAPERRKRTIDEMLADEEVKLDKVSRIITPNYVHRILKNRFYAGKIIGNNGEYIKSNSHKALISEKLFDTVQEILEGKNVSVRYTEKIDLPYRGEINCISCNRVYTPYMKKGIQYFNSRCQSQCKSTFKNFNMKFVKVNLDEKFRDVLFSNIEVDGFRVRLESDVTLTEIEKESQLKLEEHARLKRKVNEDLMYLISNKRTLLRTGAYSPEEFVEEEKKLHKELLSIQKAKPKSHPSVFEVSNGLFKFSELLNNVYLWHSIAEPRERQSITRLFFSELCISENKLIMKPRNWFLPFLNRPVPSCAPIAWFSELLERYDEIKEAMGEIEEIIKNEKFN
jgi:site-specific DNA recombinase